MPAPLPASRGSVLPSRTDIVEEASQHSLWMKQLYAGVGAYFGVGAALWIYIASTWSSGAHRPGILVVTLVGMAPVPWILRYRRALIEGAIRQPFFIAWNMACYVMILVMTLMDGGITSPIAWLWFLPTIYLLFGYSTRAIRLCAPFGLLMYLLSAWLTPGSLPGSLFTMQLVLLADCLVMVWLGAHSRDEREARMAALQERLTELASTDALTGCLNQRAFGRAIAAVFAAIRHRPTLTSAQPGADRYVPRDGCRREAREAGMGPALRASSAGRSSRRGFSAWRLRSCRRRSAA